MGVVVGDRRTVAFILWCREKGLLYVIYVSKLFSLSLKTIEK